MCALALLAGTVRSYAFDDPAVPPVSEIVSRLEDADRVRRQTSTGYTGSRTYSVENSRFHMKATMKVDVIVDGAGRKQFRVLEMTGPGAVKKMVFQKMLDTEAKASTEQDETRVSAANYDFEFEKTVVENGRTSFVLQATPKTKNSLLFRGRIWVDSVEYAVSRIEAAPAQSPSFWVKKTGFQHDYKKVGNQWLAEANHSQSDVRMFGTTKVTIEYTGYRLNSPAVTEASQTGN